MIESPYKQIAQTLAKGSPSALNAWMSALERLSSSGIPQHRIEVLVNNVDSPGYVATLADYLVQSRLGSFNNATEAVDRLIDMADSSPVHVREWLHALPVFNQWLQERGRVTTLSGALGYIECTASVLERRNQPEALGDAVRQMLEMYGFEGDHH
jgi:hypothetical protein